MLGSTPAYSRACALPPKDRKHSKSTLLLRKHRSLSGADHSGVRTTTGSLDFCVWLLRDTLCQNLRRLRVLT